MAKRNPFGLDIDLNTVVLAGAAILLLPKLLAGAGAGAGNTLGDAFNNFIKTITGGGGGSTPARSGQQAEITSFSAHANVADRLISATVSMNVRGPGGNYYVDVWWPYQGFLGFIPINTPKSRASVQVPTSTDWVNISVDTLPFDPMPGNYSGQNKFGADVYVIEAGSNSTITEAHYNNVATV